MNILDKIISHKKTELLHSKKIRSIKSLEQSEYFDTSCKSLSSELKRKDTVGIIAEIKRASPSTGIINDNVDVEKLSRSYIEAGASGLSILTDKHFFGGSVSDLSIARKFNHCPILRKDFIIDEYQILEAKSKGADCILLIAACLSAEKTFTLAAFAKNLGLEVLLEVHSEQEVNTHLCEHVDILGINNRNLKDFTTDINHSKSLAKFLPENLVKISESGIRNAQQIKELKEYGFNGFLIGGHFMQSDQPALQCKDLIYAYQNML